MGQLRLLVTGATGMLGHQVFARACADERFDTVGSVHRDVSIKLVPHSLRPRIVTCDIAEEASIRTLLDDVRPDLVVNCAGLIKPRAKDAEASIRVNALAPHLLAAHCGRLGGRLLHVSTDCVFSGAQGTYSEDDLPDPPDLYGRSKLLGEVTDTPHLTARTSFIGRELQGAYGLLEWFLSQTGRIQGFTQAWWSGWTAPELARILIELGTRADVTGLMHVGCCRIDKYSLLCHLQQSFVKDDLEIHAVDQPVIDRSFDCSRFRALGIAAHSIEEQILRLRNDPVFAEWKKSGN